MNYYFFMQSLFKKKKKYQKHLSLSIYLSTFFYFLQPYVHIQYIPIQNHPKQSHRAIQSADTNHKQILAYGCNRSTITASRSSKNWRTRFYFESIERIFQRKTKPYRKEGKIKEARTTTKPVGEVGLDVNHSVTSVRKRKNRVASRQNVLAPIRNRRVVVNTARSLSVSASGSCVGTLPTILRNGDQGERWN